MPHHTCPQPPMRKSAGTAPAADLAPVPHGGSAPARRGALR